MLLTNKHLNMDSCTLPPKGTFSFEKEIDFAQVGIFDDPPITQATNQSFVMDNFDHNSTVLNKQLAFWQNKHKTLHESTLWKRAGTVAVCLTPRPREMGQQGQPEIGLFKFQGTTQGQNVFLTIPESHKCRLALVHLVDCIWKEVTCILFLFVGKVIFKLD